MAVAILGTMRGPNDKRSDGATIAAYSFAGTSAVQIGNADGYQLADNPAACGHLVWTYGSGTVLKLHPYVSADGVTYGPAPDFGSPSSGVSTASQAVLSFAKATWDNGDGTAYIPFQFMLSGFKFLKLYVESNNASGSVTGVIYPGMRG